LRWFDFASKNAYGTAKSASATQKVQLVTRHKFKAQFAAKRPPDYGALTGISGLFFAGFIRSSRNGGYREARTVVRFEFVRTITGIAIKGDENEPPQDHNSAHCADAAAKGEISVLGPHWFQIPQGTRWETVSELAEKSRMIQARKCQ
jgi:hypothetical protein